MHMKFRTMLAALAVAASFGQAAVAQEMSFFRIGTGGTAGTYYPIGGLIANAGSVDPVMAGCAVLASLLGTMLARPLLAALSEQQFRCWAGRIVTTIACYYVGYGTWLAVAP